MNFIQNLGCKNSKLTKQLNAVHVNYFLVCNEYCICHPERFSLCESLQVYDQILQSRDLP